MKYSNLDRIEYIENTLKSCEASMPINFTIAIWSLLQEAKKNIPVIDNSQVKGWQKKIESILFAVELHVEEYGLPEENTLRNWLNMLRALAVDVNQVVALLDEPPIPNFDVT